jgi:hypothetical protein
MNAAPFSAFEIQEDFEKEKLMDADQRGELK